MIQSNIDESFAKLMLLKSVLGWISTIAVVCIHFFVDRSGDIFIPVIIGFFMTTMYTVWYISTVKRMKSEKC